MGKANIKIQKKNKKGFWETFSAYDDFYFNRSPAYLHKSSNDKGYKTRVYKRKTRDGLSSTVQKTITYCPDGQRIVVTNLGNQKRKCK